MTNLCFYTISTKDVILLDCYSAAISNKGKKLWTTGRKRSYTWSGKKNAKQYFLVPSFQLLVILVIIWALQYQEIWIKMTRLSDQYFCLGSEYVCTTSIVNLLLKVCTQCILWKMLHTQRYGYRLLAFYTCWDISFLTLIILACCL